MKYVKVSNYVLSTIIKNAFLFWPYGSGDYLTTCKNCVQLTYYRRIVTAASCPVAHSDTAVVGWLFWALRPIETVFQSISGRLPERGRKKEEMTDERKNVQTTPTRIYGKRSKPLPYSNPN